MRQIILVDSREGERERSEKTALIRRVLFIVHEDDDEGGMTFNEAHIASFTPSE